MRLKTKFKHINPALIIVGISFLFGISTYCAAAPCDFKGVSVGDKLTQKQLMAKLGIKHFKLNPNPDLWRSTENDERWYGYLGARDLARWRVGPFCLTDVCYIPFGVEIEAKIPSSMEIIFGENDTIADIQVQFNSQYWEQVAPTLIQKYGLNWNDEKDHNFVITDDISKKSVTLDRTIIANKSGDVNDKTKGRCAISATNYDSIFLHHDPLGAYQSVLSIDIIQNCKSQFGCQGRNPQ
jgi:hypothetical protein